MPSKSATAEKTTIAPEAAAKPARVKSESTRTKPAASAAVTAKTAGKPAASPAAPQPGKAAPAAVAGGKPKAANDSAPRAADAVKAGAPAQPGPAASGKTAAASAPGKAEPSAKAEAVAPAGKAATAAPASSATATATATAAAPRKLAETGTHEAVAAPAAEAATPAGATAEAPAQHAAETAPAAAAAHDSAAPQAAAAEADAKTSPAPAPVVAAPALEPAAASTAEAEPSSGHAPAPASASSEGPAAAPKPAAQAGQMAPSSEPDTAAPSPNTASVIPLNRPGQAPGQGMQGSPQRPSIPQGPRVIVPPRLPAKAEIFEEGDHVVYPTHGVGKVERIAIEEIAGHKLELIHITFEENRMTLRVPVTKARTAGLRKLATRKMFDEALAILKGKARIKRTMWSRRAQEYEAKINSGDPLAIAEVVRDLHRNAGQPDQSFSERQIYEAAMDRLAAELAALDRIDKAAAAVKLAEFLKTVT